MANDTDRRPWVKLSVDYFENFKILAMSNEATLLHIYLIVQAGKNLSDGVVPEIICRRYGDDAFKELKDQGILTRAAPKQWMIHDFKKHQTSRAKARGNPAKGAHVTHHEKAGIVDPSCEFCPREPPHPPAADPFHDTGPAPF